MTWKKARRLPLVFRYREVKGDTEVITTDTGVRIRVYHDAHYVMEGLHGEVYPITKELFAKTYKETI